MAALSRHEPCENCGHAGGMHFHRRRWGLRTGIIRCRFPDCECRVICAASRLLELAAWFVAKLARCTRPARPARGSAEVTE